MGGDEEKGKESWHLAAKNGERETRTSHCAVFDPIVASRIFHAPYAWFERLSFSTNKREESEEEHGREDVKGLKGSGYLQQDRPPIQ